MFILGSNFKVIPNYDLNNLISPVNVKVLESMLKETDYDSKETEFLIKGFTEGFDIGYEGPEQRKDELNNIPFREVGTPEELWSKVIKEVNLG